MSPAPIAPANDSPAAPLRKVVDHIEKKLQRKKKQKLDLYDLLDIPEPIVENERAGSTAKPKRSQAAPRRPK